LVQTYEKALVDVLWHLRHYLTREPKVASIYTSSELSRRVKSFDSVLRKCRRDGVLNAKDVPDRVEDIIGIRLATINKDEAKKLFDHLQASADAWFCHTVDKPKFVAYTHQSSKYSQTSGYQAYHVTFFYDHDYSPAATETKWPVEIQIMAQLWAFWAEYSRKYFYGGPTFSQQWLPYNHIISKILDNADDLMVVTREMLLQAAPDAERASKRGEAAISPEGAATALSEPVTGVTSSQVRAWFDRNARKYFGPHVNMPIDLFLYKIADELNLYGVSLERLDKILDDKDVNRRYAAILNASQVLFLPPYQKILCLILISLNWETKRLVERVNSELWLLGMQLREPES
jgi:ppGpp synthetase/RelA/SpoT-type nucleotidyltranferase